MAAAIQVVDLEAGAQVQVPRTLCELFRRWKSMEDVVPDNSDERAYFTQCIAELGEHTTDADKKSFVDLIETTVTRILDSALANRLQSRLVFYTYLLFMAAMLSGGITTFYKKSETCNPHSVHLIPSVMIIIMVGSVLGFWVFFFGGFGGLRSVQKEARFLLARKLFIRHCIIQFGMKFPDFQSIKLLLLMWQLNGIYLPFEFPSRSFKIMLFGVLLCISTMVIGIFWSREICNDIAHAPTPSPV